MGGPFQRVSGGFKFQEGVESFEQRAEQIRR